ncbi:MAG TPA: sortase [Candidatus Fimihabitans intestinipullorum]|uniref:Sortase n=1 Tax=Candidatus Fimihabitans intestinipullorum TaxID=2840820 RepID=A0A9D1L3M5_9BACT|nr:sortase [Candidatus Fimihabitans intestinipullorum]
MNQKILERETDDENSQSEEIVSDVPTENIVESTADIQETHEESSEKVSYAGILEIPSIHLKRGFVSKGSSQNKVSRNITILKESSMPDAENGNFILAAHSGTAAISYFKNLEKVKVGDLVYVTYRGKKYTYQIDHQYRVPKTGELNIYRDRSKRTITLITCASDNDVEQVVMIGYNTSVE